MVLSETNLKILSPDGEVLWSKGVSMTAPMLDVGDAYAVAYDVGGKSLYVVDTYGEVFSLDSPETLIAATLNESDWLAVTSQKQNYKGCVQVYDPEM